ncbi:AmmeMemoRadiSam system protein B [Candidatus Bathyarchaeota archaeon]|nr:AmmeMemoRadiSam system protein B [Candidatus Bathyarchaeota archaeon]
MKKVDGLESKIRYPTQSGRFYESNSQLLINQIERCFLHELGPGKLPIISENTSCNLIGLVCPHAGYMFSGPVAAHSYNALAIDCKPETVIILGPNHTGYGSALSLMNKGSWMTPLGNVEIDDKIANFIANQSKIVDIDELAHKFEHSIEVQLPFLQYLYGSRFKFVPICFQLQDLTTIQQIGKTLAKVLSSNKVIIIASSDMTHYKPQQTAIDQDLEALRAVEKLNLERFYSLIKTKGITACGYGPIAVMIVVCKELKAQENKLLCYKTSGDITGDLSSVVGYASMSFKK